MKIDNKPYYAMKDIQDQKKYLEKIGILQFFDFTFVENLIELIIIFFKRID